MKKNPLRKGLSPPSITQATQEELKLIKEMFQGYFARSETRDSAKAYGEK